MILDFVTPQRIANILTAGTPLLRIRIGRVTFVREGAAGDLVQVPQSELDDSDKKVIAAQSPVVMDMKTGKPFVETFRPLSEEWNDPRERRMRELYAAQEKRQIAQDELESDKKVMQMWATGEGK